MPVFSSVSVLGWVTLASALIAAVMIVSYLVRRPALDLRVRLFLFVALGVFPVLVGVSGTAAGMHATTERKFCSSCHVMLRHTGDSDNPKSQSLAARHARNPLFGSQNCYVCHADYGMFGYPLTKLNGMRHVYEYYLGGFRKLSLDAAVAKIHLYKPYRNQNCRQCHTGSLQQWKDVPDHLSLEAELATNRVSCASAGCHGSAHPFSKPKKDSPVSVNQEVHKP